MEGRSRRGFHDEFERRAVERADTSGLAVMNVAVEPGDHEVRVYRRKRRFGGSSSVIIACCIKSAV